MAITRPSKPLPIESNSPLNEKAGAGRGTRVAKGKRVVGKAKRGGSYRGSTQAVQVAKGSALEKAILGRMKKPLVRKAKKQSTGMSAEKKAAMARQKEGARSRLLKKGATKSGRKKLNKAQRKIVDADNARKLREQPKKTRGDGGFTSFKTPFN